MKKTFKPKRASTVLRWIEAGAFEKAREEVEQRLQVSPTDAEALFFRGACALREGLIDHAAVDFSAAAALDPSDTRFLNATGAICLLKGQPEDALAICEMLLEISPKNAPALTNQVVALVRLERYAEALPFAEQLMSLDKDRRQTRQLMGEVLRGLGRFHAAMTWFESVLELTPDDPIPRLDVALCVSYMGDHRAAAQILEPLLDACAGDEVYFARLGIRAQQTGSPFLALQCFRRGHSLFPRDITLLVNLGITVQAMGNPGEALFYLQQAIEIDPGCEAAWYHCALSHQAMRDTERVLSCLEKCLEADSSHTDAMVMLASLRKDRGKLDEAKALLRSAIDLDPKGLQAYLNLFNFLQESSEFDDAATVLDDAAAQGLSGKLLDQSRASLLLKRGDITGANRLYREILQAEPENPDAMSGLLFCSNYDPELTPEQIAEAYMSWDRRFVKWRAPAPDFKYANKPSARRRIKLGYVSGDFKQHSVAFFSEPLLANHDHQKFEIYCYANQKGGDPITQRLMGYADHWRWTHDLSDEALREMIQLDGIDILIDLSNHTAFHRLYLFGRKPAPIQMTTLGMPTTTGVSAIDYRITDAFMDPPGLTEHLHAEKLLRIVSGWCYKPSHEAVDLSVSELPALKNGYITFASFNAFGKINPGVFQLWGRLLQGIPNARLVVATGGKENDEALNDQVRSTCQDCGVPLDRLMLLPRKPLKEYFEYHGQVDVVLDAFPYTGATVTAHALWMGVPVITLAGKSPIHRSATSMMSVIGLPEFVAQTPDEYIGIAQRCAADLPWLASVREGLRERAKASPLMDGAAVTRDLESKLRKVWQEWCRAQKSPKSSPTSQSNGPLQLQQQEKTA